MTLFFTLRVMQTSFHVFEEPRCFGDEAKHQVAEKWFVSKYTHMIDALAFIEQHGNTHKAYIIQKYIGEDLRWRTLCKVALKYVQRGVVTTTWARFYYNTQVGRWKESNFRYNDEIVG